MSDDLDPKMLEQIHRDVVASILSVSFDRPIDDDDLRWLLWITPREWQFLYVFSLALVDAELLTEEEAPTFGRMMRAAAIYTALEYGYEFAGIAIDDAGELWFTQADPVSPENKLWLDMLHRRFSSDDPNPPPTPDFETHLSVAIDFAKAIDGFDVEPLLYFQHMMERDLRRLKKINYEMSQEEREELRAMIRERHEYFERIKGLLN